ncbi:MAG: heme-binding protein [Nitratireductor sp.]
MSNFLSQTTLSHSAVMKMLQAAIAEAEKMGVPQCIIIVDQSGETHGEIRMSGSKFLSRKSAHAKALTAASVGKPGTAIPQEYHLSIAAATNGQVSGLPGGLPIIVNDEVIGGIGVGSGSGEQDIVVAKAALEAIGASTDF